MMAYLRLKTIEKFKSGHVHLKGVVLTRCFDYNDLTGNFDILGKLITYRPVGEAFTSKIIFRG